MIGVPKDSERKLKIKKASDLKILNSQFFEIATSKISWLLKEGKTLLNWGGDHAIGVATVAGFLQAHQDGVVLWVDAHADANIPESSLSGNLHGMPISILMNVKESALPELSWLKKNLCPKNLIYLGLRDVDPFEKNLLNERNILAYTMNDIDALGLNQVLAQIQARIGPRPLHVSFDIDSVAPELAPSTGVPVRGGFRLYQLKQIASQLSRNCWVKSLDIVEVNPLLGSQVDVLKTFATAFAFVIELFSPSNFKQGGFYAYDRQPYSAFNQASMEWNCQIPAEVPLTNADGAL